MNIVTPTKIDHYEVFFEIGAGSFSTVFRGRDTRDGKIVAMKFVNRKDLVEIDLLSCLERELRISRRLSHKSIVKIYDTIFTNEYVILVMENLSCGTLSAFKQYSFVPIQDATYLRWGKEILEGLLYLHERNICHHDIKPDNIGFDDYMHAKIFDFGLCEECMLNKKKCENTCGTPLFVAPEVITDKEYDGNKADIWSFGVTFHFMVTGELPFQDATYEQFVACCPNVEPLIRNKCVGVIKEIIDATLITDPKVRPSALELLSSKMFDDAEKMISIPRLNHKIITRNLLKRNPTNASTGRRLLKNGTLPHGIGLSKLELPITRKLPAGAKIHSNVF